MRVRLRSKLLLGLAVYLALLAAVGVAGLHAAQVGLNGTYAAIEHHVREVDLVGQVSADVNLIQANLMLHALSSSADEGHAYEQQTAQLEAQVSTLTEELLQVQARFNDARDIERIRAFRGAWDRYVQVMNDQFFPLSREQRDDEAFRLATTDGALGQSFAEVRGSLGRIETALAAESIDRLPAAEQDFARDRDVLIITLVIAGVAGVILGLQQATRLARAIEALSQGARRVASGNFGQRVRVETGDELEDLAGSFNTMTTELRRIDNERQTIERMKNEFVSMVSHELRTPMNGVLGMTSLLLRRHLGPQEREYAEAAQHAAEALLAIINDILDLSKIEAGRLELEAGPVDVRNVVEDLTVLLAGQAHARGLEIACAVDPRIPADLIGDTTRLRQILTNLLGNAIKFTQAGEVVLRATLDDAAQARTVVRFEVSDTGIGIPDERRAELFRAFSQLDTSTTRRTGGTGLGLAISRRLAELMGGAVGFESEAGHGSTFWATLPFARDPSNAAAPDPGPAAELGGYRVLVVHDSATSRSVLVQQLEALRMEVESVGDGDSAQARLRAALADGRPFAIALVDRHLANVDGLQLARQIRADTRHCATQLVLLNRLGESPSSADLVAAGIAASLEKPIRQAALVENLTRAVSARAEAPGSDVRNVLAAPELDPATPAPRLLLVEDVPMNRRVAAAMLSELGFEVDLAANGREALEALDMYVDEAPYAAVLMDCQMPEMDGFEATAAIRRRDSAIRTIPIIAITASAMRGDRERCLQSGMDEYLAKPLRFGDLESVLRRLLPNVYPDPRVETIDRARLAELVRQLDRSGQGDAGALESMIAEFRADGATRLDLLRRAIDLEDPVELSDVAHRLRGQASVLGASEVHALATQLEQLGRGGSVSGADVLLEQLRRAVTRASGAFESALARRMGAVDCAS